MNNTLGNYLTDYSLLKPSLQTEISKMLEGLNAPSPTFNLPPIKRKDKYRRVIAFTSDLHTLSRYALAPKGFISAEGGELKLNPAQEILLKYWMDFIAIANKYRADTVCIVGDAIEGQNYRESGIQLMSTDLDEQVGAAVQLIKPLVKGKRLFMWSGSGYHRSTKGHNPEKDVCDHKDLVAVAESTNWMGPICNLQFPPSEKIFNIQHGVSAAFIYQEMLMGRESLFINEAEALGKIPKIDVVVRGHWHKFIHIHKNRHAIQLPGWQIYKPWKGSLMSYGKMQPDIGGVIIFLDKEDRLTCWHYLYPLPHVVDNVLMV